MLDTKPKHGRSQETDEEYEISPSFWTLQAFDHLRLRRSFGSVPHGTVLKKEIWFFCLNTRSVLYKVYYSYLSRIDSVHENSVLSVVFWDQVFHTTSLRQYVFRLYPLPDWFVSVHTSPHLQKCHIFFFQSPPTTSPVLLSILFRFFTISSFRYSMSRRNSFHLPYFPSSPHRQGFFFGVTSLSACERRWLSSIFPFSLI